MLKVVGDFNYLPYNGYDKLYEELKYGLSKAAWLNDVLIDGYKAIDYIDMAKHASSNFEKQNNLALSHHKSNSSIKKIDKDGEFHKVFPYDSFFDGEIVIAAKEFLDAFTEAAAISKSIEIEINGKGATEYPEA
jgi:hypothetical protein